MPSQQIWRQSSLDGDPTRKGPQFEMLVMRGGERFVLDRETGSGYFLRGSMDTWPFCAVEARTLTPSQRQQPPVVQRSAVDEVFVRYVRQKCIKEATMGRAGRKNSTSEVRWLQALFEGAQEVDFLTDMLAHTVQRSGTEVITQHSANSIFLLTKSSVWYLYSHSNTDKIVL